MLQNNYPKNLEENNKTSSQNPFNKEEVLQDWLENDVDYLRFKRIAMKQLRPKNNTFMSFQNSYLSFIHLITKNAIVATLLMLVSVGAVSASALQAFAPEEYKPSTVIQKTFNPKDFAVNTVKEKNPYTPLNYDENSSVVFVNACDLAVKYPSKYSDGEPSTYYTSSNTSDQTESIYISSTDQNKIDSYTGVGITCLKDTTLLSGLKSDIVENGQPARSVYGKELKVDGTKFIKDNLGWFITQSELKNVRIYQSTINKEEYTIYFEYNNLYYLVGYQTSNYTFNKLQTSRKVNVVKGGDIQVQFISLVNNQANKTIVDGTGKVVDKETIATASKAIIVEPKNAELGKFSNDIPYVTDGYGQNGICGVLGVTRYQFEGDRAGGYMQVTSSKLNLDDMQKKSYNRFNDFLNGKVGYNPDFANGINYIEQFSSTCSGIAAFTAFIDAPQIAYPKTDKVKVVYTLAGQAEITGPVVLIFASKGDNQILLEDNISEIRYPQIPAAVKCGYNVEDSTKSNLNRDCYENILKNDPKLKAIMDQAAKDLVKTFELK